MVAVGTRIAPRPPHRSRRALLTHRAPPSGRTSVANGLDPSAVRRTAANRIDVATRLSVRTTAVCRLFPLGEALPSTTSAGSCLPLFGRFVGTIASSDFSSTCMLGVRLMPSRAGPAQGPGMDETSQVPRKERLHVHKVSDCARFFSCKPFAMRRCCLLFNGTRSAPRNWTRFAAQYLARGLPCERFTSALAGRRASLGVGAVGYSLPREGLAPPILCQLVLAHSELGHWRPTHPTPAPPDVGCCSKSGQTIAIAAKRR